MPGFGSTMMIWVTMNMTRPAGWVSCHGGGHTLASSGQAREAQCLLWNTPPARLSSGLSNGRVGLVGRHAAPYCRHR